MVCTVSCFPPGGLRLAGSAYETRRIGACRRPYKRNRGCVPPLIRHGLRHDTFPQGKAYASPVSAYRIQAGGACRRPYKRNRGCVPPLIRHGLRHDTFPQGKAYASPGSAYRIRAHRGMPPPLQRFAGSWYEIRLTAYSPPARPGNRRRCRSGPRWCRRSGRQ